MFRNLESLILPILIYYTAGFSIPFLKAEMDEFKDQEIPFLIAQLIEHPDRAGILLRELASKKTEARKYSNLIAMYLSSPNAKVRRTMMNAMGSIQLPVEQAAPWAIDLLRRDSDEDVRVTAASVLEGLVCKEWDRKQPGTRVESADGLPIPFPVPRDDRMKLSIEMRECLDALTFVSAQDKSFKVRARAAFAAAAINPGDKRILPALVEAATNKKAPHEKYCAITILRSLDPSNQTVIQFLYDELSSTESIRRVIAVQDLNWLQVAGASDRLEKLLKDPDERVRAVAKGAIDALKAAKDKQE